MGPDKHDRRPWRKKHNFWREWHEQQNTVDEEDTAARRSARGAAHFGTPPQPPRSASRHWRHFFHNFMGEWPEEHWAFGGRRFSPWHQGIDSYNPFLSPLLSKGGGLLPLIVLQLLMQRPQYGNEIMDSISERTEGQWVSNPGAIYPLLTMLEEEKLVEGEWGDPRKRTMRIYHLTATGEEELERLKAIVRPKLEEAIKVLQDLAQSWNGGAAPPPGQTEETAVDKDGDEVIYL
jgi:DNA-binding PadR family transcriptional regulator